MKLSAIIIAKNEEKNLEVCLKSMIEVFDDIVVIVDSSTTDNTLTVASKYQIVNCEVRQWQGYALAKSYAVSKTKHDWVFWIDADEELTKELADELIQLKQSSPRYNCYNVARRAYFLGKWIKHSGWYPARVKRFFNKNYILFDDKQVHEGLIVNGEIGSLKYDLNHYTDPSIEHYFIKFNLYTSLAAKELFSKKRKAKLSDILFRPLFLFLKMYIFKRGFLDGLHGFILAIFSSVYVFAKYSKLWELNRNK
ncbi:MAG: glycosyl transferase family 2 [Ignavibacteria bacterium]|nr:MAG: glycosyl transferase family 2 [Ignavibacteria bacterium]KAF0161484.1 MAG: glycosyl transferase family 2 [Ignavibacteria bacterium]